MFGLIPARKCWFVVVTAILVFASACPLFAQEEKNLQIHRVVGVDSLAVYTHPPSPKQSSIFSYSWEPGAPVAGLSKGQQVTVIEYRTVAGKYVWAHIRFKVPRHDKEVEGWVFANGLSSETGYLSRPLEPAPSSLLDWMPKAYADNGTPPVSDQTGIPQSTSFFGLWLVAAVLMIGVFWLIFWLFPAENEWVKFAVSALIASALLLTLGVLNLRDIEDVILATRGVSSTGSSQPVSTDHK